ncbi:MAG: AAA family ATPase [Acidihalobacter sp.]|uniref:AAA family ATPase n=1 Tax=Acidihalobacter sp. TaxID=1872108 RepID=UPI00307D205D
MVQLPELLRQSDVVTDLVARLAVPKSRVWLQGPSGSGKTTIASMVVASFEKSQPVVCMTGDAGHSGTKFLALYRALAGTRRPKAVREAIKASVTAPLRAVPIVGATAAELAKIAVAAQSNVQPEFLTAEQQDLLQGLQGIAKDQRLVIVVDDVGWLDADTARLIVNFDVPEIEAAYPFVKNVSILFIENSEARITLDADMLKKLRPPHSVKVSRISRANFPLVLKAFGLQSPVDEGVLDAVYSIVHGHLEITKQIAITLGDGPLEGTLAQSDAAALMSGLLSKRLAGNEHSECVRQLLCLAACVGSAFSEAEVRCAYKDDQNFPMALEVALREQLFRSVGTEIRFAHEAVRSAAENLGALDLHETHEKLTSCIKLLRPGDYAARLKHARLSGNAKLASELAFVVSMQAARGERVLARPLPEVDTLSNILEDASTAYRLMDAGQHQQALELLMPHYTGEFSLVQGEIVALIALNQIKRRTMDAYAAAASLLEHWLAWRDELEIWQRLMSILIAAWAASGDMEQATRMYTRLAEDLSRRSPGDPTARSRVEALNRKADQFFTTEIATKHIQRAADWFAPEDGSDTPRHAFEYTASLVNLSAAQYTLGQFSDAATTSSNSLSWIDFLHQRGFRTTEPYKALNNYVIAAYRANIETADTACDALGQLLSEDSKSWRLDRSLVAINQAALMLLAERTEAARDLLEVVWNHVGSEDLDPYYALYAGSNLAVALAVSGERANARRLLETSQPYLEAIPKWFRNAHARRLSLMLQAVEDTSLNTAIEFDAFPTLKRAPNSNQDAWWSIGRGLLMSDIQVWSEG